MIEGGPRCNSARWQTGKYGGPFSGAALTPFRRERPKRYEALRNVVRLGWRTRRRSGCERPAYAAELGYTDGTQCQGPFCPGVPPPTDPVWAQGQECKIDIVDPPSFVYVTEHFVYATTPPPAGVVPVVADAAAVFQYHGEAPGLFAVDVEAYVVGKRGFRANTWNIGAGCHPVGAVRLRRPRDDNYRDRRRPRRRRSKVRRRRRRIEDHADRESGYDDRRPSTTRRQRQSRTSARRRLTASAVHGFVALHGRREWARPGRAHHARRRSRVRVRCEASTVVPRRAAGVPTHLRSATMSDPHAVENELLPVLTTIILDAVERSSRLVASSE